MVQTFVLVGLVGLALAVTIGCSDDEPKAEKTSGGESAFDRAERNANEAQKDFQKEFKETGDFIDEKANKAAAEGRKGARKVGDAISGDDSDEDADEEPQPGQP